MVQYSKRNTWSLAVMPLVILSKHTGPKAKEDYKYKITLINNLDMKKIQKHKSISPRHGKIHHLCISALNN